MKQRKPIIQHFPITEGFLQTESPSTHFKTPEKERQMVEWLCIWSLAPDHLDSSPICTTYQMHDFDNSLGVLMLSFLICKVGLILIISIT